MKILSRNPNAKTRIEDSLKLRIRMGIYIQRMLLQGLDSQIVPHHKICHEYMSVEWRYFTTYFEISWQE